MDRFCLNGRIEGMKNKYFLWPLIGQIPLTFISANIYFTESRLFPSFVVLQLLVLVLGLFLNKVIYRSDRFAKYFIWLSTILTAVFIGLLATLYTGPGILILGRTPYFEAHVILPYLIITTLLPAILRRRSFEPTNKNVIAIIVLALTFLSLLPYASRALDQVFSATKSQFNMEYTVLDSLGYIPDGYEVYSKDYYDGGVVMSLVCKKDSAAGIDPTDKFLTVNEYTPGFVYDDRNHGPRPSTLSADIKESREVEIRGIVAVLEEEASYESIRVEQEDGRIRYDKGDAIGVANNKLTWEEGGLIIELHGHLVNSNSNNEGPKPWPCSLDGDELIRIAESLK